MKENNDNFHESISDKKHSESATKNNLSKLTTQLSSSKIIKSGVDRFSKRNQSLFSTHLIELETNVSKSQKREIEYNKFRNFMSLVSSQLISVLLAILIISSLLVHSYLAKKRFGFGIFAGLMFYTLFQLVYSIFQLAKNSNTKLQYFTNAVDIVWYFSLSSAFLCTILYFFFLFPIDMLIVVLLIAFVVSIIKFFVGVFTDTFTAITSIMVVEFVAMLCIMMHERSGKVTIFSQAFIRYSFLLFQILIIVALVSFTIFFVSFLLFLNLRKFTLNLKLKNKIVLSFFVVFTLYFILIFAMIFYVQSFGNFVPFINTAYEPKLGKEAFIVAVCCVFLSACLLFVYLLYLGEYEKETYNILFRLVYDLELFVEFNKNQISGFFGYRENKMRIEFLKGKLREIKVALSENQTSGYCYLCEEKQINVMFEDCKHSLFCEDCFEIVQEVDRTCPECDMKVDKALIFEFDPKNSEYKLLKKITRE